MKYLFFFIIFLTSWYSLSSQNIAVASFRLLPNDLDARVNYPTKDQNGDVCAIIKVVTTESGFGWDGDQLGIMKIEKKLSEYWLYVPYGAKRLTIQHEKLGQLRDYIYPESITKATVYEMVLLSGKVKTIIEEGLLTIWLTIRSNPEGAEIYINDVLKGLTPLGVKLVPGKYSYRIEKSLYYNFAGIIEISGKEKDGKKDLPVDLKPAFGIVKINSLPEQGAKVLIDDVETGRNTPFIGERIKSGKHKITLKKELYQPKSIELTLKDGETIEEIITMNPNFANVTITTIPNADIYIDGEFKAKNRYQGRIAGGVITVEARKENYYTDKKDKEIAAGDEVTINLKVQPKMGNIEIVSNPIDAKIFLNNEEKGVTPITLQKQLAGNYELKLEKKGYRTVIKSITIDEGKTTDVNERLDIEKPENIKSFSSGKDQKIINKTTAQLKSKPNLSSYRNKKSKVNMSGKNFDVGINSGVNLSKFSHNYDKNAALNDFKSGYTIGAFMRMGEKFYIQPEVLYVTKNTTTTLVTTTNSSTTTTITEVKYKSYQVPILVGLKFFSIRAFTGPSLSYTADTSPIADNRFILNDIIWDWKFGAGVDFGIITFDISYEVGLNNLSRDNIWYAVIEKGNFLTASVGIKIF